MVYVFSTKLVHITVHNLRGTLQIYFILRSGYQIFFPQLFYVLRWNVYLKLLYGDRVQNNGDYQITIKFVLVKFNRFGSLKPTKNNAV